MFHSPAQVSARLTTGSRRSSAGNFGAMGGAGTAGDDHNDAESLIKRSRLLIDPQASGEVEDMED
jgi:hypothetical protein